MNNVWKKGNLKKEDREGEKERRDFHMVILNIQQNMNKVLFNNLIGFNNSANIDNVLTYQAYS